MLMPLPRSCAVSELLDSNLDFQFYVDTQDMQLVVATPRGGPVAGDTRVRLTGSSFGAGFGGRDIRCRFGWYEVEASYVDRDTLHCDTPPVAHPHTAELSVSSDGGAWSAPPLRFAFYAAAPTVSSVWPRGGPSAGGTPITVRGAGFADYDGLVVLLGAGPPLRAWLLSSSTLVTTTANFTNASVIGGARVDLPGGGFSYGGISPEEPGGVAVRVSPNGALREHELLHGAAAVYRFYDAAALRISEVFPTGAHAAGGEVVTLHGAGFVDLGAPRCAFGTPRTARGSMLPLAGAPPSSAAAAVAREGWGWAPHEAPPPDTRAVAPHSQDALLHLAAACGGRAACAASAELLTAATVLGPNEVRCAAPAVEVWPATPQPIELSLNGDADDKTAENHSFAIFGQPGAEVVISSVAPQGAPIAGGTLLTIRGQGLFELGDARVRFGRHGGVQPLNCTDDGSAMSVLSPAVPSIAAVRLAAAPDGVAYSLSSEIRIALFDAAAASIARVFPQGGPVDGGTLVTLHGAGFVSAPAACLFGDVSVAASLRSAEVVVCEAPPAAGAQSVVLELSLNGETRERSRTDDGVEYHFYDAAGVAVTGVFPLGGPALGGTNVTVTGSDFADRGGVFCRFGGEVGVEVPALGGVVPATLLSPTELLCLSPAANMDGEVATVELTLNDDLYAFIPSSVVFLYENTTSALVTATLPVAGPMAGGSLLEVSGVDFRDHGTLLCRFGSRAAVTNATLVSSSLMRCRTPPFTGPRLLSTVPADGQHEWARVSLNGQQYLRSEADFVFFEQPLVHVSAVVPQGGRIQGGTRVVVLGSMFADHAVHCRFGTELVEAKLLNGSALECIAPVRGAAVVETVEVTLNKDIEGHSLTSDGVEYHFYDESAVAVTSVFPLGGPALGGTNVTVTGSGFADRGGVFCRFGATAAGVVPATLLSPTELLCEAPVQRAGLSPLEAPPSYRRVEAMATCCADGDAWWRGGTSGAASPADCEATCSSLAECRFFSHSASAAVCRLCSDCDATPNDGGLHFSSWVRLDATQRWSLPLRVGINGLVDVVPPPSPLAANFSYYAPQLLGVSSVLPLGGPRAGGTNVTITGSGFTPLGSYRCMFGAVGPAQATLDTDGTLRCTSPSTALREPMLHREEVVHVSLNGQQYSAAHALFGAPLRPLPLEPFHLPAFTFYDAAQVRFSSISPAFGPRAGGTEVTITGSGFAAYGAPAAKVVFIEAAKENATARNISLVPATLALGTFRGRVLQCVAPAWLGTADVRVELSLNGDAQPAAMTNLGEADYPEHWEAKSPGLRYAFVDGDAPPAERWRVYEEPSPPPPPPPKPPGTHGVREWEYG